MVTIDHFVFFNFLLPFFFLFSCSLVSIFSFSTLCSVCACVVPDRLNIQVVLDYHACVEYLAKYVSKGDNIIICQ